MKMGEQRLPDYVRQDELEARLGTSGISLMEKKYLPRDDAGAFTQRPHERFYTVARKVAEMEGRHYGRTPEQVDQWTKDFYEIMTSFDFLPGGRVLANAGTEVKALPNCYVLPVRDDLFGIYTVVRDAAVVHKNGGGTGYNFSRLRPRGAKVKNGVASGPVSFAGQFDKETEVINSGNRRGANMGILDVDHPDIFEFIRAKMQEGRLANFNISVGITDEFMHAYATGGEYALRFNGESFTREAARKIRANLVAEKAGSEVGKKALPPSIEVEGGEVYHVYPELDATGRVLYVKGEDGFTLTPVTVKEKIGRVDADGVVRVSAKKTLDVIAKYAHQNGEPGLIFLDSIEKDNMLRSAGRLDTTNPCGEQPLHPYDACNLGSINLGNMVRDGKVDYERLERTTRMAMRFMDDVNDLTEGPIKEIEETVRRHRRTGLGVMGWADMLMKLGLPYDSERALRLGEEVMGKITDYAKDESRVLAGERGTFPDFEKSDYPQDNPQERVRNLARTTIAPTGSIAMLAGVANGIEPYFGIVYYKKMRGGDRVMTLNPHIEQALRAEGFDDAKISGIIEKIKSNGGLSCQGVEEIPPALRAIFRVAGDISYADHVKMQAAFQRKTDNAISKTINMPNSASVEDVQRAYVLAHRLGCKGITVYRDGSRKVQVLEAVVGQEEGGDTPQIHFRPTLMGNNNIHAHVGFETGYYKVKRPDMNFHVIIPSRLFRVPEKKEYYLLPHSLFQQTKPIGSELAGELSQSGIDRTQFLQGPDPDYVTFVRDLKSVRGDKSFGMGPHRIDSLSHAVGLCVEHFLVSHGVLGYDDKGMLIPMVKKPDLEEVATHEEANKIVREWYEAGKVTGVTGEMKVTGNRDHGIQFKCAACGETKFHVEANCPDPVCSQCGWSAGKCG